MPYGKEYSPSTLLTQALATDGLVITVADTSVFPPATVTTPEYATIGDYTLAEVITYTGISGNTLTGVKRGVAENNVGYAWPTDTPIANYITRALIKNIIDNVTVVNGELLQDIDKTLTLTAAGWSATAPFTQTVTVTGLASGMTLSFGLVKSSTLATALQERDEYAKVDGEADIGEGTITFKCLEEKPSVDLNIELWGVYNG
jgi:hypothetical protein